jgi:hypothetical protein
MANVFKNALQRDIGTTPVTMYSAPASKNSIVIELDVCNTSNAAVTVNAYISRSGSDYYLVKNAPVPTGGTLQIISGQKIVLTNTDALKVVSNTSTSIDAIASILEDI